MKWECLICDQFDFAPYVGRPFKSIGEKGAIGLLGVMVCRGGRVTLMLIGCV